MWTPPGLTRVRTLGHGAESEVILCRDDRTGDLVSLKLVRATAGEEARRLLGREHEVLRSLRFSGLPVVREVRVDGDPPYLVYDYVVGESLADRTGPIRGAEFDVLALGLMGALFVLHDRGWVHYDVTPRHVLRENPTRADGIRLIDAGLAGPPGRTLRGTPGYMAPEILRGEPGGPQSDVWSAALVLAETALGEKMLTDMTPREMLDESTRQPASLPSRTSSRCYARRSVR